MVASIGGAAAQPPQSPQYASTIHIYDTSTKLSAAVYSADGIWEAPNWTRDGGFLVTNSGGRLFRIPVDRGAAEPLRIDPSLRCNNDHDFSRDGRLLAISASSIDSRQSQIYVANADGSNHRLIVAAAPSYFHGWSPDGKFLSFVANRDAMQYDLYRIALDGGVEERLTMNPADDDGTDYSPDGKWIYFNSNRGGGWNIWRMPATGAGPDDRLAQQITNDELEDWFPHPSPDGKHIVFLSFPAGTRGHNERTLQVTLRMIPMPNDEIAAAAKPVTVMTLSGGQGTINVNSWAPDSRRFAYVSYRLIR